MYVCVYLHGHPYSIHVLYVHTYVHMCLPVAMCVVCRVHNLSSLSSSWQAYTSQFLSLVMFALVVSEDSISKSPRRKAIIDAMLELPGVWEWA